MPKCKRKSNANRLRQEKERKRESAKKQQLAKRENSLKDFMNNLENILSSDVFDKIKNVNNHQRAKLLSCFYKSRSIRKLKKCNDTDLSTKNFEATAVHLFFRMGNNMSTVFPYHLDSVHRKRIKLTKLACSRRRIFQKKLAVLRLKQKRRREKEKYQRDKSFRELKQQKCKAQYSTNKEVQTRESTRMRTRYQTNQHVREREQARNRLEYQQNEDVKQREQARNRLKYQQNEEVKRREQERNRLKYQQNEDVKLREQARNRLKYQQNEDVRRQKQAKSRLRYQTNEEVREREQQRNRRQYHKPEVKEKQKRTKQQRRQKPKHFFDKATRKKDYQNDEQLRNKTKVRSLKRYHANETVKSSQAKRKRLSYQENEPACEKRKSSRRLAYQENEVVHQREKSRNRNAYRNCPEIRKKVKKAAKERKRRIKEAKYSSIEACMEEFFKIISQGPTFVCCCCAGLFYEETTKKITLEKMYEKHSSIMEKVLCYYNEKEDFYRFCGTCHYHINKGNIPRCALSNGLDFPEIPEVLKGLNRLEIRMVALRIPFMNLRSLGSEGQWGLRGNVVNVENNLEKCVQALPRKFDEMSITQLKFKRRMSDKNHFIYDKIRPKKVVEAVKYLLKTPMYARHNVLLNENWDNFNADEVNFIVNEEDKEEDEHMDSEDDEMPNDIYEENNIGAEETLYFTNSTAEPLEVHIAPGEGNVPIPTFRDPDAEYLSFPQIYCGQERNYNPDAKISTTDRARSEIRRNDRRCAIAEKILYIFKMLFVQRIRDAFQIALRQKKTGDGGPITAKHIRTPGFLEQTLNKNDGYTVFKNVRSTPAYWKDQVKRVVAMVRQLGNCALFITLSAAETKWNELLVILMKVLKGKEITEEQAEQLSFDEKCDLIRSDPVTCARHFDHKYRALKKHLLCEKNGAFSPHGISDYYSRIEYQMRGSPHSHGLYWIKDAPQFKGDEESALACIAWIDRYITCKRDENEDMFKYICYQNHSHSHSCYKCARTTRKCRFHFPRPPLPETMILTPLGVSDDTNKDFISKAAADYTKIEAKLIEMGKHFKEIIPFEDFIDDLDLSMEEYITAIRSTIKRTAVFLKRETNAAYINNYNRNLLYAWRANMDIQFILDPYACAKYCVGYMLKSEGGMSKLLKKASDDARKGNLTIAERLKQFGSILINGTEISGQEAVGFVLGLKNTDSSRGTIFINTNRAEGRIGMLKSQKQIEELPDDSEDICIKGLLDRYTKRSDELEDVCLADYAAFYEYTKKGCKHSTPHDDNDEEDNETKKTDKTVSKSYWQQDESGFVKRRKKSKIIRYRHFSKITEPREYYRERLMLFLPWRDEAKELDEIEDTNKKFIENIEVIKLNSKEYQFDDKFDEEMLRELVESSEFENEDDDVVTNELQDLEDERYAIAEMTDGPTKKSTSVTLKPPKMLSREDYCKVMRSLNVKQRRIVNEVLHRIKNEKKPFYIFLSGGAGVGKSHVITAIVQSILHYRFQQNGSPEDIPVVVTAPTGKAAFNVAGMTLHTAFKLTANQAEEDKTFVNMDGSTCNALRIKYAKTDLFVIDEISMVGSRQGGQVSTRLSQINHTPIPVPYFGGKPVIVCGDFRQLPPCGAYHIFKSPEPSHETTVPLNPLWEIFEYFELDEIMRQKGELKFCKALNNMAKGQMDQDDIDLMKSREMRDGCQPPPEAVYLFKQNDDCAAYNAVYHANLNTQGATSIATDKIYGRGAKKDKDRLLKKATTLSVQKCDGLMHKVQLQVGGIFMVTTNVDVSDGIFNGSTGILKHVEFARNANERVPIVAWMQFLSPVIGQEMRNRYKSYKRPDEVSDTCVPIERHTRPLQGARRHMENHDLVRTQIPLLAANAMTIHKSQGSTLENVVVNTSIRKLDRQHLYVACSRATRPNGLWFQGKFTPPDPPAPDDPVEKEIERLRKNPVKFSQLAPATMSQRRKIYFHNIESFRTNQLDIEADQNINCCDIVAFVEHHVHADQQPTLNGFQRVNFVPCEGAAMGDSRGSLIFSKLDIPKDCIQNFVSSRPTGHFIITVIEFDGVYLIVCYKHPNFSSRDFIQEINSIIQPLLPAKIVLVGDVNINIAVHHGMDFKLAMTRLNLKSCLVYDESTTNKGTQIDVCFSNISSILCSTYETYYSYHRGICILFN